MATRSPLLTQGLVTALRAEDIDAAAVDQGSADGDAVWIVDATTQRRARASGARMVVLREDTDRGTSMPTVSMRADLDALLDVLRGDRASRWVATDADTPRSPLEDLSTREREIVEHVAQGWTNQRVAEELGISANTVRTHLQNVMSKLAVANRRELAALVTGGS